jgi:hypothetical protein
MKSAGLTTLGYEPSVSLWILFLRLVCLKEWAKVAKVKRRVNSKDASANERSLDKG